MRRKMTKKSIKYQKSSKLTEKSFLFFKWIVKNRPQKTERKGQVLEILLFTAELCSPIGSYGATGPGFGLKPFHLSGLVFLMYESTPTAERTVAGAVVWGAQLCLIVGNAFQFIFAMGKQTPVPIVAVSVLVVLSAQLCLIEGWVVWGGVGLLLLLFTTTVTTRRRAARGHAGRLHMHSVVVLLLFSTLCRYMGHCLEYRAGGERTPLPTDHRVVFWRVFAKPQLEVCPELIHGFAGECPVVDPNTGHQFFLDSELVSDVIERYVPNIAYIPNVSDISHIPDIPNVAHISHVSHVVTHNVFNQSIRWQFRQLVSQCPNNNKFWVLKCRQ